MDNAKIVLVAQGILKDAALDGWLREAGFDCQVVDSIAAITVTDRLELESIDLVILPAHPELKTEIKPLFDLGYLSVVAIGKDDRHGGVEVDCLNAGVDRFVAWPINRDLLLTKICSALRFRRLYQYEIEQRRELLNY